MIKIIWVPIIIWSSTVYLNIYLHPLPNFSQSPLHENYCNLDRKIKFHFHENYTSIQTNILFTDEKSKFIKISCCTLLRGTKVSSFPIDLGAPSPPNLYILKYCISCWHWFLATLVPLPCVAGERALLTQLKTYDCMCFFEIFK